jgi:chaperonin GroES
MGDRLIVQSISEPDVTPGGIFLPDVVDKTTRRATVLAVGDGAYNENTKRREPLPVQAGDVVVHWPYRGNEITFGSEQYLLLREEDLVATVEGES